MNDHIEELLEELKTISKSNSDIQSTVLFGSYARKQNHSQSDIDICMIITNEKSKNKISNQILGLEKKYNKNINILITTPSFKDLDRQLVETILREGIVLYGTLPDISIKQLELEPYVIIKYDLSHLSQSEKMKIKRLLYGIKTKKKYKGKIYESKQKGIVEDFGGLRIGIASILIPEKLSWEVEDKLRQYDISLRKITIWLSKP
jgi:predicted nucleotidyltransferase